jgi:hypothetical protein
MAKIHTLDDKDSSEEEYEFEEEQDGFESDVRSLFLVYEPNFVN